MAWSNESTRSRLKRISRNFDGLSGNIFNTQKDLNDSDYFEGWICTGTFFMNCESLHLPTNEKNLFK